MARIKEPEEFALSEAERRSPLWQRLEEHFRARIAELQGRNEGDHDPTMTATLRGQIKTYRALLSLGQE